jgi:hypothetical protein
MQVRRRRRVKRSIWERDPNIRPLDQYTVAHFFLGMLYGTPSPPWWVPFTTALVFEWIERPAKRWNPEIFPVATQDSWINSALDIAAVMAGWFVMSRTMDWAERAVRAP